MGSLIIRAADAQRRPLPDKMDVRVVSARTDATVSVAAGVAGDAAVRVDGLIDGQPYIVKVFPMRHRPVAQFSVPKSGDPVVVQVFCPIDPARVTTVRFPTYPAVSAELRGVLENSTVEGAAGPGEVLYSGLTDTQRAGMFNLFAKMSNFGFDEARTVWTFVKDLYRIRADRVFANVEPALRDLVKDAVVAGRFHEVPATLHTPPVGFLHAGSFKTEDHNGNLQLTFFASQTAPLTFKVDADIDDAAGLGHTFQVLRNAITHGTTHPYDIHEILVFRQEVTLPYDLA